MTRPILVTGADGMLGHKMLQTLSARFRDVRGTLRGRNTELLQRPAVRALHVIEHVDLTHLDTVDDLLAALRPAVIVNCAGVIKQRTSAQSHIPTLMMNAVLPHRLAAAQARWGGRLIHFSTDCVFNGRRGRYTENDLPDAVDLYGRTKALGEVTTANALTLRTSIIGRELKNFTSLLEWFLAQSGRVVPGFTRVLWSGVTTNHLADLTADIICDHAQLTGLYQVSSGTISKYDLLVLLQQAYQLDTQIKPDDGPACDRSLLGHDLRAAIGYECPPWNQLLSQLVNDATPYQSWSREHVTA